MRRKRLIIVLLPVFISLLMMIITQPTSASYGPTLPLEELVKKADYIVIGTFNDYESYYEEGIIYTKFNLSVDKVIKGNPNKKEMIVISPGGKIGDKGLIVTGGAPIIILVKGLFFLNRYKEGEEKFYFKYSQNVTYYFDTKLQDWKEGEIEKFINSIVKTMLDNKIPVALPLSEQLRFPALGLFRFIAILLVAIILLFGVLVLAVDTYRSFRKLPNIICIRGWNIIDWFWLATLVLSLAFVIYVVMTIPYLWWIGLIAFAIFWGGTAPLTYRRLTLLHQIRRSQ